jgi:type 1 glutamine amidotransferase
VSGSGGGGANTGSTSGVVTGSGSSGTSAPSGGTATGEGGQDAGLDSSGGAAGVPVDATTMAPEGGDVSSEAPPLRPVKAMIYVSAACNSNPGRSDTTANTVLLALRNRGFTAEISKDQTKFSTAGLADLTLVIMVGTCGTPLGVPETQPVAALDAWLKAGGAFVGIHIASDVTYAATSRFVAIMGGRYISHPGDVRPDACVPQGNHPSVVNLPTPFNVLDEIYVFDGFNPANQVDLRCPGLDGALLPIAWHRTEGMGRVFYTALGHRAEEWAVDLPLVKDHVLPGILWAARQ